MERAAYKVMILKTLIVAAFLLTGCEEQNLADTKRHRLIAAENIQLKKQLEGCLRETENQKTVIDECLEKQKILSKQTEESVRNLTEDIAPIIIAENQQLQARIEELKKEVEELKKEALKPELP